MSTRRNLVTYKGYVGAIRIDAEEQILRGRIINIEDIVTFQGRTVEEIKAEFVISVDDYLEQCARSGNPPDRPFSGRTTLRMKPETRLSLSAYAQARRTSLAREIATILDKAADRRRARLMRDAVALGGPLPPGVSAPERPVSPKAGGRKLGPKAGKRK